MIKSKYLLIDLNILSKKKSDQKNLTSNVLSARNGIQTCCIKHKLDIYTCENPLLDWLSDCN